MTTALELFRKKASTTNVIPGLNDTGPINNSKNKSKNTVTSSEESSLDTVNKALKTALARIYKDVDIEMARR